MSRKPTDSELSKEQLNALKENARGILAERRKELLVRYPFIGGVSMSMDIIPVRDCRCPTACCDGRNIYFDIAFLSTLKPAEQTFILGHEIWHAVCCHMDRGLGYDPEIFNLACDIEVNQLLKKDGLTCPIHACLPEKFGVPRDKSAEEYYELLLKKNSQVSFNDGNSGAGGNGNSSSSKSDPNRSLDAGNGQFDKHVTKGQTAADMEEVSCQDKYGKVGFDEDFQPDVDENVKEKIREAVVNAAQQLQQRGTLPNHIEGLVKDLLTPKVPWQEVLSQFITRTIGAGKNSWSRPNRRFAASGTYLPSHDAESCRIGIMLDTSGSCTEYMKDFLSEVNGIVKAFPTYKMTIVQCDAKVQDVAEYNTDNPIDPENQEFCVKGYGGTQLTPGLQYFEAHDCEVDAIVAFSDCYCEEIREDVVGLPLLWVCTEDYDPENIHCGQILHFDKKANK